MLRSRLEGGERRVPGGHCRSMDAEVRSRLEGGERRVPGGHCRSMDAEARSTQMAGSYLALQSFFGGVSSDIFVT